uniref:Arginine deiminase n=1 Tax=Tetraselmis sp. GSL018 TaxID=582737 RepID=A0A061SHR1_9CHLO
MNRSFQSARDLLNEAALKDERASRQEHENDVATTVIVCEPERSTIMMGGLHPRASLFEKTVHLEKAVDQHRRFRQVLEHYGLKVITVQEALAFGVEKHTRARIELEELAMRSLEYKLAAGSDDTFPEEDMYYLSDGYKRHVLESMSVTQIIDTILTRPIVHIAHSGRDTGMTASYSFRPLSNLIYTRDQQITTCKGVVMARLRASQRQDEVQLMKHVLTKTGLHIVGEIEDPGFLEGGDFFAAGRDLALLGVGLRSNMEAAKQLMEKDLLGCRRLAVVRDDFEQHQDRMHLDCCFSILTDKCCLMLEEMIGEDSPTRRLVDEFTQGPDGKYTLTRKGIEFSQYVKGEGYHIIPISGDDQKEYGCNVLNLGKGKIISVHGGTARQIVRCPEFTGDVQVIDFDCITSMYGAVHCSSQVVHRVPRPAYGED